MSKGTPEKIWPLPIQKKIEGPKNENKGQEEKLQRIKTVLNEFFVLNNYKDTKGNIVKMEEIIFPTIEEGAAYKSIMQFLDSEQAALFLKEKMPQAPLELIKIMAKYINEATTFDSLKTQSEHSQIRRKIEGDLHKAEVGNMEKYHEAYNAYYENRLSLRSIRNSFEFYSMLFKAEEFSPKTNDLYKKGIEWLSKATDGNKNEGKKYEFSSDAEKLEATHDTVKFLISFFSDLEKISKREKVVPALEKSTNEN